MIQFAIYRTLINVDPDSKFTRCRFLPSLILKEVISITIEHSLSARIHVESAQRKLLSFFEYDTEREQGEERPRREGRAKQSIAIDVDKARHLSAVKFLGCCELIDLYHLSILCYAIAPSVFVSRIYWENVFRRLKTNVFFFYIFCK